MQIRNSPDRWGVVQQTLHWLVVPLALVQLGLGMYIDDLPRETLETQLAFGLHASLGLTIGAVMLLRFLWRLVNPVPLMPERLGRPARAAVRATHYGFYVLLVLLPATGYLMASARGYAVPFFAWTVPNVIGPSPPLAQVFLYAHLIGVALIYVVLGLHVAGALRHEFVLRDNTFRRMTPLPPREDDHRARTTRRSPASEGIRARAGGRTSGSGGRPRHHARAGLRTKEGPHEGALKSGGGSMTTSYRSARPTGCSDCCPRRRSG